MRMRYSVMVIAFSGVQQCLVFDDLEDALVAFRQSVLIVDSKGLVLLANLDGDAVEAAALQ